MAVKAFVLFFVVVGCVFLFSVGATSTNDAEYNVKEIPLKTDDQLTEREGRAISHDGFSQEELHLFQEQLEKHQFQAEVNRLMDIIVNSLYSNNDVFLRELISNASDALDKIRFAGITNSSLLGEGDQAVLDIRIRADRDKKTLEFFDNGCGMTKDELVRNLGTIAQSGTTDFLKNLGQEDASNLIGQFGVGFYSAFLVAHTVVVTSKSNDDPDQWIWESSADSDFSIAKDPRGNTLGRGTSIVLHLKDDAVAFLEEDTLETLIHRYSDFINFPIFLWSSHQEEVEVPVEDEFEEEEEIINFDEDEFEVVDDEEKAPKTKKVQHTVWGWKQVNTNKPIWTRSPSEISQEEYYSFYKSISKDYQDPSRYIHFKAEGDSVFTALLYIPKHAPSTLWHPDKNAHENMIRLYVRRVFITGDFFDLLPGYLRFVRGVVDSDDLSLNLSREHLQESRALEAIKKKLVRKSIAMFQDLYREDREEYERFYEEYGTSLKLGVIEDQANKARLSKLLLFHSSKTAGLVTFDEYIERMKEDQQDIYYLAGESIDILERSPLVERLIKKGFEVLYMTDPIDEYAIQHMGKYDLKYELKNVAREGISIENEEEDIEELNESFQEFKSWIVAQLSEDVERVVVSTRLESTPLALVSSSYGYTANMERILKAQTLGTQGPQMGWKPKKVMEINPMHPTILELQRRALIDSEDKDATAALEVLYQTALIQSGWSVEDPARFSKWIQNMVEQNLEISTHQNTVKEEL